jgi:hypothetical protein
MTCSKTRAVTQLSEQNEQSICLFCDDTAQHLHHTYLVSHQYRRLYAANVSTVRVYICGPISCETVWQETKEGTGYRRKLKAPHRCEIEWEMGHIHVYYLN